MAALDHNEHEDQDGIIEGQNSVPVGYKWYLYATIAWMIYYIIAYMPAITGWSQTAGVE